MFKFIVALYFFVCSFLTLSGKPDLPSHKSFIISLNYPSDAVILHETTGFRFSGFEALNIDRSIFKASYNTERLSQSEALNILRKLPCIRGIQENTRINSRSAAPNDSMLSYQWHLDLIKANKAWDLSRGGINRRGDTIVIAIVDDGLHTNHPDFKGNIWINYADTAGNGLDDDGNGFIDDHYGWNFMGRNNDISDSTNYAAKHGSSVAGVIGASGNEITGICGILWKVKLMIVDIADTSDTAGSNFAFQSDVIRAYDYVLQQRKLYNLTNGTKGAFVVAINSSWGVDGKFADDAPVWCAMYDSLGKSGILTAGATTNGNTNVEISGDLPSLCTSDHLIMVSSVNKNDGNANRGYGMESIDLSAPGESVFTTYAYTALNQSNSLYGTFSGTSAATPMVTAAIGLLNAYACEKMMDLIKSNPVKANLLMRRFILDGVDTLPVLVGKNATTGRLNIFKSMKIMDEYCYGVLNLNQPGILKDIVIFPNPGNGLLNIESFYDIISVECNDITGKAVEAGLNENKVDISLLNNGIYFFRVKTSQGVSVVKYLKVN